VPVSPTLFLGSVSLAGLSGPYTAGAVPFRFVESIGVLLPVLFPLLALQDAKSIDDDNAIAIKWGFIIKFNKLCYKNYACLVR